MAVTADQLTNILQSFPVKDLSAFHIESLLGGGGFSHVILARDVAGHKWALKLIPAPGAKDLGDVDSTPLLLSEARIHLMLSGEPSVLPCMEAFKSAYVDLSGDSRHATYMAVLRMPVAACSVEEWLFAATPVPQTCRGTPDSQVDETEVLSVWLQMVNAVHRCHAHGIIHKDIKLPNFLMDHRGKVQVMDFGLAQVEGISPRAVAGTPWTMSPAGLKHGDDGRAGEWWALGVVLYQLLQHGTWPFKHCWWPWQKSGGKRMEAAIRRAVLAGRITFPHGSRAVSEPVKALIRGLLQPDPNRRWQLRQVLACEVIRPELLSNLAERFPELAPDMQMLLNLQRRAREVQAMGSDGGSAAAAAVAAVVGLAAAGSAIAAAASNVLRTRGMTALVGEGGLHWPHWHGPAKGDGVSGDGGSYRPLLDGEDLEEGDQHARRSGPSAPLSASAAPPPPPWRDVTGHPPPLQTLQQLSVDSTRLPELQDLSPEDVPDAHSLPSAPNVNATVLQAMRAGAAPAQSWLGSNTSKNDDVASIRDRAASAAQIRLPGSLATVNTAGTGPATGGFPHVMTTSASVHTRPSIASISVRASDVDGRRDAWHPHPHYSPSLSRQSLTGPLGSPGQGSSPHSGAQTQSPSPRSLLLSIRSRTSLHELFGPNSGSHFMPVQPQPYLRPRPTSGGSLGEVLSGIGRGSWPLPHGPASTMHPQPGGEAGGLELLPPQSSWVPPPPEAFTAASHAAAAGALGFSGQRANVSSPTHSTGAAGGPVVERAQLSSGGCGYSSRLHASVHAEHLGLLARARRIFTDCLQRPTVKYDAYGSDGYDTMPATHAMS